jgi:predicted lactoylglutathione lyase
MMTKELWLNLPVKDIAKAKDFFSKIGFRLNEKIGDSNEMACFLVGDKNTAVMLFPEKTFKDVTKSEISDTKAGSEVLISVDAENRDEVDEMARKVFEAGGRVFAEPAEIQGWMYGCAFADLDGHRWNMLYRDMSKMPQA